MPVSLANHAFTSGVFSRTVLANGRLGLHIGVGSFRSPFVSSSMATCSFHLLSFRSGSVAMTDLGTPLWIPQAVMPIGFGFFCIACCNNRHADRAIAWVGARRLSLRKLIGRAWMQSSNRIFGVLLLIGMPIPIAIMAPGLVYLVIVGGFDALKGIGLVSWGSTNSFTLTAVPMFILMAQILRESGLSTRVYEGLSKILPSFRAVWSRQISPDAPFWLPSRVRVSPPRHRLGASPCHNSWRGDTSRVLPPVR